MQFNVLYLVVFLVSVFISSISQILLKKSANRTYESKIKEYLNPLVIIAYIIFFGSTLLTIFAYKEIPLSLGPVLEATGYIWVSLLGMIFLKEKLNLNKIIGLVLIIGGIIVYSM